jgi:plasmid stability protein
MVQGDKDGWVVLGVEAEARQIIKAALDSGQHDAVMVARRLVELLIARGQYGFRTLLS